MKKLILILCAFMAITATAQTTPSYPTVKLTKPATGAITDDILTIGESKNINKVSKASLLIGLATTTYVDSADATKEPIISFGTNLQYLRGDKSWQTLPTYTLSGLGGQPLIAAGTASQYWRGDKTWQALDKAAVGLGNVDNTSDTNKPVSTSTQTALNTKANVADVTSSLALKANLASPIFTGTVSGIDKTMVGLPNVDNTSDANKPVSTATQAALNLKENLSNKNTANGYAGLGADGKLISNQLPAIAITDTYVINTQAAMLALTAETGDVAIRTDLNKSFILQGATASILSNWQELLSPTGGTTSVFGRTGSVVANAGDYNTSQVTEIGNLYYTDARVNANANVSANTAARHNAVTIGTANGLSLSAQALSLGLASSTSNGALSSTDWNTFNGKQNALGFTPYNSTNPSGYITGLSWAGLSSKPTTLAGFGITDAYPLSGNPSGFLTGITSANVTSALGFTPYNSTNPNGYISGITSLNVTTALGYTPYNSTNPSGYITGLSWAGLSSKPTTVSGFGITDAYPLSGNPSGFLTGITSANVTSALGFTPYNSTNPNGYITSTGSITGSAGSVAWTNVSGRPTNVSSFTNDSGYINTSGSRTALSFTAGSGGYNSTTGVITIPTNTNQLTNGAGFITGSYLPLSGGTVTGTITATAFYASSDRRLKNIISRSGDMIEFTWKDKRDNKKHFGYVAQEVKKKMPEQVNRDEQGYMSVNYIEVLVAKVNALELEVQSLKEKLK